MQVVHTFNTDIKKQGTVEDVDDSVAKTLIKTGRARAATDEEISTGHAAELTPAAVTDSTPDAPATPADATSSPVPAPTTKAEPPAVADTNTTPAAAPSTVKAEPKPTKPVPSSSSSTTPSK